MVSSYSCNGVIIIIIIIIIILNTFSKITYLFQA
jgi:hypothetical protein